MVSKHTRKHYQPSIHHNVVTLNDVVIDTEFVTGQHGATLLGLHWHVPAVIVGTASEEQGTQRVQYTLSVTGHTPH
jgi:hypothetical protein